MFFVIYGLTGNPLFDYTYVVPYLFAIAIFYSSAASLANDKKERVGIILKV